MDELAEDGVDGGFVQVAEFGQRTVGAGVAPLGQQQHGVEVQHIAVLLGGARVGGEGGEFGEQVRGDGVAVGFGLHEGGDGQRGGEVLQLRAEGGPDIGHGRDGRSG